MQQNENIEDIYPLSPLQEGILFHSLYTPRTGVYFVQTVFTLRGRLDLDALKNAWRRVIERHPVLRTFFIWERRERPLQVVRRRVALPWEEHDWRATPAGERAARLEEFLEADQRRGFELSSAPLTRLSYFLLDDDSHQIVWSFHHLLLDGWSIPLLLNEVLAVYEAERRGRAAELEPVRPYRDYIGWLRRQPLGEAEAFWRETLKGFRAPTRLGVGTGPAADDGRERYEQIEIKLAPALAASLQAFAQKHGLTTNTLVEGAFALLLGRYEDERDVVFGFSSSGRPADLTGVERMVGMFINTLPLRVRVEPREGVVSWLRRLQGAQAEARQYEYSPLVEVQAWSEVPRGTPLFESLYIFENYPGIATASERGGEVEVAETRVLERTNYPLTLVVIPAPDFVLRFLYERRRFAGATVARMLGHLETLLAGIVEDPARAVAELPLLADGERAELLALAAGPREDFSTVACVHEWFEAQAARAPERVALRFKDEALTYGELNARANRLARHLRGLGVGPEVRVAIALERSSEMVVALLAVLKAGGAYVPLDPAYPRERVAFMLEDSRARVLVTRDKFAENFSAEGVALVRLETDAGAVGRESADNLARSATPDNLAYVIYTSGSTGRPKGVLVTHRNVVHSTAARVAHYGERVESFLLLSSVSFDSSVAGIFWTLSTGGALVIPEEGAHQDPAHLARLIEGRGVTHLLCLPSLYALVLEQAGPGVLRGLRASVVAGEACPASVVARHAEMLPRTALFNEYGPTEGTVWASVFDCGARPPAGEIPIGRPIANTALYVLDSALRPLPLGVAGELYIGGAGLARGYHLRAALTAERFVPDPFSAAPCARLYRTGDLARYLPDGNVEFLGRADHQVKIRGFRIELEEIEAVLQQHPSVREAAVVARADAAGDTILAAYLTAEAGAAVEAGAVRAFLRERVPEHMVPQAVVTLDALPLAPNGKVDRKALPEPQTLRAESPSAFVPPGTETERVIADIWREVLKVERVGTDDNFFDLGGHSLRMIQVRGKLQEALGREIPMTDLFKFSTVSSLAEFLSRGVAADDRAASDERVEKLRAGSDRLRQRSRQRQLAR
ncbi:MAG TPA: amino acid adenylation domain-containing protein [Pyrinomonadaceae bacterium]|nr:amino acid adenylation domain-containing protein [Pyrinomonadaceae bacterium]